MTLMDCKINQRFRIIKTPKDIYIEAIGVIPESVACITHKLAFGGPIVIRIADRDIALDRSVAEQVQIEVISNELS